MPATFHNGIGGTIKAGAVTFAVLDWQFTTANKLVDVTNSGSAGYEEYITSVTGGSGTANCLWDSTNIPDAGSPGPVEPFRGTNGANDLVSMELTCGNSAKKYSFSAVVESLAVTSNAAGGEAIKFSVAFKSSGAITTPS